MKWMFQCFIVLMMVGIAFSAQAEKIQPRLATQLEMLSDTETVIVWVFFTDKGDITAADYTTAENQLSEEAQQRRLREKGAEIVGYDDIAVNSDYIEQILPLVSRHRATSKWLNAISIEISVENVYRIASFDFVQKIQLVAKSRRVKPADFKPVNSSQLRDPEDYGPSYGQVDQINVIPLHDDGYAGEGIIVAMLDTGYNFDHEAFDSLDVLDQWDFIDDDDNAGIEPGDPQDQHRHGSLTWGACGGYSEGHLIGPAYEATFILCKTEDTTGETPVEEDYWVEAIEWAEGLGARVVSSSLGYIDWYVYEDMDGETAVTTIAANTAAENGVLLCNSNGNNGAIGASYPYMNAPADAFNDLSVGAVDSFGVRVEGRWWGSSIGPTYDGRIKPEVMAQGLSTYTVDPNNEQGYSRASGTSLSCPLISGAVAAVWSMNPNWTMAQVREAFMETASQADDPDNYYGWGIANAYEAANYLEITSVSDNQSKINVPENGLHLTNYPNPFNPQTTIRYTLSQAEKVHLNIYDVTGKLVKTLVNEQQLPNAYTIIWNGTDDNQHAVESGVYFSRLETNSGQETTRMVLLR